MVNASDRYHRAALALVAAGAAQDESSATNVLHSLQLHMRIASNLAHCKLAATVAETIVRCASRSFLGGVTFEGPDAGLTQLGARAGVAHGFTIGIGDVEADVHVFVDGMRGGIVLPGDHCVLSGWGPAGVAGAALAVAAGWEWSIWRARLKYRSGARMGDPRVGRNGLDLLEPGSDWYDAPERESRLSIPQEALVLGSGNLGQAFLYAFETLPFSDRSALSLVLQDYDSCQVANLSTSILSEEQMLGKMKTRVCAEWLQERAISSRIVERALDERTRMATTDPPVMIAGVDRLAVRRLFDAVDFPLIIDAGLGSTPTDMTTFQITTLPGHRTARELFADGEEVRTGYEESEEFKRLVDRDPCGATTIANTSVGLPFIGVLVGAIMVGRLVAHVNGIPWPAILTGDIRHLAGSSYGHHSSNGTVVASQCSK